MQRMPVILERRHRLLHMRASLERKCSQPRCHPIYIGPSLNSEGRPHGHRYGKTPQQREYHQAHNLKKRCIKRSYQGIHDPFLTDPEFRASQLEHDGDEEVCIKMDDLADKDFSHYMTKSEYFRYKQNWWISVKKSGNTGPWRNRSDFNEALSTLNLLHQESGERPLRPMPFWKYQDRHQSSSSSSSWWQWSGSWWSS